MAKFHYYLLYIQPAPTFILLPDACCAVVADTRTCLSHKNGRNENDNHYMLLIWRSRNMPLPYYNTESCKITTTLNCYFVDNLKNYLQTKQKTPSKWIFARPNLVPVQFPFLVWLLKHFEQHCTINSNFNIITIIMTNMNIFNQNTCQLY